MTSGESDDTVGAARGRADGAGDPWVAPGGRPGGPSAEGGAPGGWAGAGGDGEASESTGGPSSSVTVSSGTPGARPGGGSGGGEPAEPALADAAGSSSGALSALTALPAPVIAPVRGRRTAWRVVALTLLVLGLLLPAGVYAHDAFDTRFLSAPWLAGVSIVVFVADLIAWEVLATVGLLRLLRRAAGHGRGPAGAAAVARVLLVLFVVLLVPVELFLGFLSVVFSHAGWAPQTDSDGSVVWVDQTWLDRGCDVHRSHGPFLIDREGTFINPCDLTGGSGSEDTAMPEQPESRAAAPESSSPDTPVPSDPQSSATTPGEGESAAPTPLPARRAEVSVVEEQGRYALGPDPVVFLENTPQGWMPVSTVTTLGEPVSLFCRADGGECLAGVGTATGGEVWRSADHSTWTRVDLPASLSPDESFLRVAHEQPDGWQACLGLPEWTDPEGSDLTCLALP